MSDNSTFVRRGSRARGTRAATRDRANAFNAAPLADWERELLYGAQTSAVKASKLTKAERNKSRRKAERSRARSLAARSRTSSYKVKPHGKTKKDAEMVREYNLTNKKSKYTTAGKPRKSRRATKRELHPKGE